tara:strand:- start:115 stop:669 length:555 start_codon:yes stop_codon:yes gene_type:complete
MPITINGNGTITGYSPTVADGSITTSKLASDLAIPTSALPANTLVKYQTYTNSAKSDVSSNQSWTKMDNTEITFTPTYNNSKIEIQWHYSMMTNGTQNSGIGIQVWKEVGGTHTMLDQLYQFMHFAGGGWDGPGQVSNAYCDTVSSTTATSYYLKAYKEGGSNLSINYGEDTTGVIVLVKEIKQ